MTLFLSLTPGCRGRAPGPGAPGEERPLQDAAERAQAVAALAAEAFNAELQFSPVTATWLGDHRFDDRLDDVRPEAVAREVARLRSVRERAAQLATRLGAGSSHAPGDSAEADLRLDLRLLSAHVDQRLLELTDAGPGASPYERDPLFYMNLMAQGIDGLLGPDFLPVEAQPLRVLTRRLAQVPALCQEALRSLRNPPELATRKALEIGQGTLEFLSTILPRLVRGVADSKALEDFRRSNDDARRALEDFLGVLARDVLPRARGDFALGRERLTQRLRAAEQLDISLEALQALGEREARETRRRLEDLARRLTGSSGGPGGPRLLADAQRALEEDHPRPEELLPVATGIVEAAFAATRSSGLFPLPTQPWERPQIEEMPPHRWGFAQLQMPGPLEKGGIIPRFYVDPVDPAWEKEKDRKRVTDHLRALNRSQLTLTALHTLAPGHFLQQALHRAALREPDRPLSVTRGRLRSAALVEGWPMYAADLLLAGTTLPERERLQFLLWRGELLQLGRLVVALRLHAAATPGPASRLEDAARYLTEECGLDDYAAHREAERATYDPFFLLPALGRLQLHKLHGDYLEEHAEGTATRALHEALLQKGELPVTVLRMLVLTRPGKSL